MALRSSSEGWHVQQETNLRGRSQSPVVWIAEVMETETLKPIDKVSPGEATSHRAVTSERVVASKVSISKGRARTRNGKYTYIEYRPG